jgi:serine/threonine protein kinase
MQWEELKLFEREAQVLKHLDHPKIPNYRDNFSIDETDSGLPWFVLVQDYIPGKSLRQLLDEGQRFSETQTQKIATEVLNILAYLHELSPPVLHRDIKPSNLLLGEDGSVFLVDFGAVQDRAKAEGATFTVVGTSGYAAPEQLWGRAVPASDLYALGATLIHLLTGIAPADLPQNNLRLQFADKVSINPSFTYWLEKLIDPALEQRFSSVRQALNALEAACSSTSSTEKTQQPVSHSAIYGGLAVLAAVLAVGGGLSFAFVKNLMDQTIKAKQSEAKIYVGAMNRAQQAYYLEYRGFSNSVEELGLGIQTKTENYDYSAHVKHRGTPKEFKEFKESNEFVLNYAISHKDNLKSYVGIVFVTKAKPIDTIGDEVTMAVLCEADSPGSTPPSAPVLQPVPYPQGAQEAVCGSGTTPVSK